MATQTEILSLVYEKQAAGDVRPLTEIKAEVEADLASLFPVVVPAPGDVAGQRVLVMPDGSTTEYEIMGDGSERVKQ